MTQRLLSVCLIMAAVVSASDAFASRAREQVMGSNDPNGALSTANHGSLLIDDNYNMFYNPAYLADYRNWVAFEKDNGNSGAEAGFAYGFGNMTVGLFMNRGDAIVNSSITQSSYGITNNPATITAQTIAYADTAPRPIDVMWAGDFSGMKFGLGLTYGYRQKANPNFESTPDSNNRLQDLVLKTGASVMDFEPFVQFKVIGKDDSAPAGVNPTITEQKSQYFLIGTRYRYGEWTPFAYFRKDKVQQDVTPSGGTAVHTELKRSYYGLGFSRTTKMGEGTNLSYGTGYHKVNGSGDGVNQGNGRAIIPIELALEHDVASWIAVRAGASYRLWDQRDGITAADSTTGRLGASFKWGKATMDWAVGGTNTLNGTTASVDSQNFDVSHGFFSSASLTYAW